MNFTLVQAVREHRIVTFWYDGLLRTVEPHIYGINTAGHEVLSGYQITGFSQPDNRPDWRLYLLSDIHNLTPTDTTFGATRPGYNPHDSRMSQIFARTQEKMMRLTKFRVTNFKSIKDSWKITIDCVTCLVGKNEAGKTALFEALAKLNSIEGMNSKFELEDYPRRKLNTYKREPEKNPAMAIQAEFELTETEMNELADEFGQGIFISKTITISNGHDNIRRWDIPLDEAAHVQHLVNNADMPGELSRKLGNKRSINELLETAQALEDPTESIKNLINKIENRKDKSLRQELCKKIANDFLPEFF